MLDIRGNPLSTSSPAAIAALDRATAELNAFHGDPVGLLVAALREHRDFVMGHAFLATVFATSMDAAFDGYMDRALTAAEGLAAAANDRERAYIAAARLWRSRDFEAATEAWGAIAVAYPRDILAVQMAQQGDFFLGRTLMLRDRIARVLPHWDITVPGQSYLLGMYAFGLEETGDYARAEEHGREAVARDPQDAWGAHAVAHVMEMQGRADEGAAWLRQTQPDWDENGLLAGYAMLQPKAALAYLDERLANPKEDFLLRYACLRTARFLWEQRPDLISEKELVHSMVLVARAPDMSDFAIEDLRRWNRWEATSDILDLFGKKGFDTTLIKRSILRYALHAKAQGNKDANTFVAKQDPAWVRSVQMNLEREADLKKPYEREDTKAPAKTPTKTK